jgi:hypothetical protein
MLTDVDIRLFVVYPLTAFIRLLAVLGAGWRSHTASDLHNSTPKSKRQTAVLSRRTF